MSHRPEESPALRERSRHYPATWRQRVPRRVRMAKTVYSDLPTFTPGRGLAALAGREYQVLVNSHGAVTAILEDQDGRLLGLKPYEFEIVEWHATPAAAPQGAEREG